MYKIIPGAIDKDIMQCVTLKTLLTNQNQIVKCIQVSQRKEKENRETEKQTNKQKKTRRNKNQKT